MTVRTEIRNVNTGFTLVADLAKIPLGKLEAGKVLPQIKIEDFLAVSGRNDRRIKPSTVRLSCGTCVREKSGKPGKVLRRVGDVNQDPGLIAIYFGDGLEHDRDVHQGEGQVVVEIINRTW